MTNQILLSCEPVAAEIADPVSGVSDQTLFTEFPDVFTTIAEQQTATQMRPEDLGNIGHGAERALVGLGCAQCALGAVCTTAESLQRTKALSEEGSAFLAQTRMLESQPRWLASARIAQKGVTSLPDFQMDLVASGTLDLSQFMANTENKPGGFVEAKDLPELATMRGIPKDSLLEKHVIRTANSQTYEVIDATDAVGFKDKTLSSEEYGILSSKFLNLMSENDSKGNAQITQPDGTMQKPIRSYPNMFELRMSGKNRMYFTMHKPVNEDQGVRIVILGSHGGDTHTQDDFIAHL